MSHTPPEGTVGPRAPSFTPSRVVAVVTALGILSVLATWTWSSFLLGPVTTPLGDRFAPLLVFVLAAFAAEFVYYPVRHGDGFEELTFFEIVLVAGILLFSPMAVLLGSLVGKALAELVLVKTPIKTIFNVSSYAIATSAFLVIYWTLGAAAPRFGLQSVLALLAGALAFVFILLLLLAWILSAAEGLPLGEFLGGQWPVSVAVAVVSVGIATSLEALVETAPVLAPFTLLPAAAMWYAYSATAKRTEASNRADAIIRLSRTLTATEPPDVLLTNATEQIRHAFGANEVRVMAGARTHISTTTGEVAGDTTAESTRLALAATSDVAAIPEELLPEGWTRGYLIRLRFDDGADGAVAMGATAPPPGPAQYLPWATGARDLWKLKDDEWPVFSSLSGALASALRAGQSMSQLRDETAKLTAVVDHATDGIAVLDRRGEVRLWSPAMTRITDVTPGTSDAEGDSARAILDALAAARERGTADGETELAITRPDGEVRDLDVAVVVIDDDDGLAVLTVRDMTRQRRLDRMKQDFIATVSHELKTPITPIKGYAQLLSSNWEKLTPEKRIRILSTIEERANHLSRLVEDLLLASRASDVDSAKLDVRVQNISLAELVKREVEGQTALAKRLSVSGTDALVLADVDRARQCLANLIGNAGKYSEPDSPIVVEFGPLEGERWAAVDVIDQGSGIPADEQDKVFDKFYRVEDPMTMTTGGNGLGLFISRQLARAMDGDITLESTVGVGSRFRLTLPIEEERR